MTGAGVADFLPVNCVLLISENQAGESSVLDVLEACGSSIKDANANGQFDVTEAEGGTEGVGGGRFGIFAATVEIGKTNIGHIDNGVMDRGGAKDSDIVGIVD
jgi:hypothetical protein